jgi:flagellar hook-basal body complex protein FliE
MKVLFPGWTNPANSGIKTLSDKDNLEIRFTDYFKRAVEEVDRLQKISDASAVALATGEIENLHQVMIDAEKAEIALQFTLQVRNKMLDAYQEIMRMQI